MKTEYSVEYITQKIDSIEAEVKEATKRLKFWKMKLKRREKEVKNG